MNRTLIALVATIATLVAMPTTASADPIARASAVCADFPNQAAAQAAANTRDSDGDGIYCESLPCPCSSAAPAPGPAPVAPGPVPDPAPVPAPAPEPAPDSEPTPDPIDTPTCTLIDKVVEIGISKTRYPAVLRHMRTAIARGWPRVLRINRVGADARRDRAVKALPTRRGFDRDEWPMAFARKPWRADVAYVPSSQNRGAGSSIGLKLRRYCDGQRFRVIGY